VGARILPLDIGVCRIFAHLSYRITSVAALHLRYGPALRTGANLLQYRAMPTRYSTQRDSRKCTDLTRESLTYLEMTSLNDTTALPHRDENTPSSAVTLRRR